MTTEELRYSLENRLGVSPDELRGADLRAAGLSDRVFLLPNNFNDKASYMAGVLVQMFGVGSPVTGDLRMVAGVLCQSLSYLMNSTSWAAGELHGFDLSEIRRKVNRLGKESS